MDRKTVEPMTVLYATQELTIPEVGRYAEKYLPEILAQAKQSDLKVVGPWVFISYQLPKNGKDRYRVEFCLPIAPADNPVAGAFPIKSLGQFSCAFVPYHGGLRQLFSQGYQPLVRDMVAAKMAFTGESREVYHAWNGPNSPDNRVEIQFGVA